MSFKVKVSSFFVICILLLSGGFPPSAQAAPAHQEEKRILFLSTFETNRLWTQDVLLGFITEIAGDQKLYETDLVTLAQIQDRDNTAFEKLQEQFYDVLVVLDNAASSYIVERHAKLPENLKIVCLPDETLASFNFKSYKNITGVVQHLAIADNLSLGMKLFPSTKKILFLMGATLIEPKVKGEFEKILSRWPQVKGEFLSGSQMSTKEMLNRMKENQEDTLILFSSWRSSLAFRDFPVQWEVLMNITAVTNAPILVMNKSLVGYGALGGWVSCGYQLGADAARTVLQLLNGKQPEAIPWKELSPQPIFDSGSLKKYDIDISELPVNSVIRDHPSKWHQYKKQLILTTCGLLLCLAVFIAFLIYFIRYRRQKQRADILFKVLPVTFGIIDQNHEIFLQHGHQQQLSMQYMKGKKFDLDSMPEDARLKAQEFLAEVDNVIKTQFSSTSEFTSNGKRWRLRLYPLPNGILPHPAVIWVTEDINDLFKSNQRAQELVANLQTTLSSIGNGVITTDINEVITLINPTASALTGVPQEEAVGKPLNEVFKLVNDAGAVQPSPIHEALQKKTAVSCGSDLKLLSRDGSLLSVANTATPIIPASNAPTGAILVFRDITDECRNREKIRFDHSLLKQAAAIGKIEFFQCDATGKVNVPLTNKELWPSRFDGSEESLKGWVLPDDAKKLWDAWQELLKRKTEVLDLKYRAGKPLDPQLFRMRVVPEYDENSKLIAYSGIIQDITESSRFELERMKMLENDTMLNHWLAEILKRPDPRKILLPFLGNLLQSSCADRVSIFEFSKDRASATCRFEKAARNIPAYQERGAEIDFTNLQDIVTLLNTDGTATLQETETDAGTLQYLEQFGIKSQLMRRIFFSGRLWGYIALDYAASEHTFTPVEDALLYTSSGIASLALERHYHLATLNAGKNMTAQLIDASINLFMLFDIHGKLQKVNKAVCRIIGKTEEEILSRECHLVLCGKQAPPESCPLHLCMKTGKPQTQSIQIKDRIFQITAQPIYNAEGEIIHYVESGTDITTVKEQQQALTEAVNTVQSVGETHISFMNNMSHKLRTPLNTVIGFSELLGNTLSLTGEQQEYFTGISNAGHSLLNIIDNMQELSKLESGDIQLNNAPTDLLAAIRQTAAVFKEKAEAKNLEFQLELPGILPTMEADGEKIKKVLDVLLSNAVQNTNRGYVKLQMEFSTLSSQEQKGKVTFNICDTGTGFPVEELDRLQQDLAEDNAKYSTNKHCTGNGLGLPIAIYLVNAMKGKLSVNSIEHVGSVFTVELDVSFIEEHPSEDLGAQKPVKEKNDKDLVLIVDDIELNIKLISAMLRRLNVNFVTTTSGQAALEIARNRDVTLILSDVWMPNMTGEELAEKLAESPVTSSIPIVAVTADTQVREGHFVEVLYKPIKLERLSAIISRYCRNV